jgi:hypothetical protein
MKQSSMFDDAAGSPLFSLPDTPPVEPPFQTPKEKGHAMLIARSQPKQSVRYDNAVLYKEYRVRKLTEDEKQDHASQYNEDRLYKMTTAYVFEVQVVSDNAGKRDEGGWTIHDWADTAFKAAIFNVAGYLEAESLHPLHRQVVEHITTLNTLRNERRQIDSELNGLAEHYRNLYAAELKSRRMYKKAMDGKAPQDVIDSIRFPMIEECNNRRASLKKQIADIDKQIESL